MYINKHKSCTSSQRQEDKFISKKVDCKKFKYKNIIVMANRQGSIFHTKQSVHESTTSRYNTKPVGYIEMKHVHFIH